jgi:hypothetical protein
MFNALGWLGYVVSMIPWWVWTGWIMIAGLAMLAKLSGAVTCSWWVILIPVYVMGLVVIGMWVGMMVIERFSKM